MTKRLDCMTYNLFEYLNGDMDYSTFIATHPTYNREIFVNLVKESITDLTADLGPKYTHFFFMAYVDKDKDVMLKAIEEVSGENRKKFIDKEHPLYKRIKEIDERSFNVEGLFKNRASRSDNHFEEESIRLFFLIACVNMIATLTEEGKTTLADYCVDTCLKTIVVPNIVFSPMNDFDYTFLKEVYVNFNEYKKDWRGIFTNLLSDPKVRMAIDIMEGLRP